MRILSNKRGMTAAELLVASVISVFLTLGLFSFASFVQNSKHEYQSNIELTNDARSILEKMVWGHRASGQATRRGIAEAVSGTIVSASQFQYTDVSGVAHTLRVTSGTIEYQRGTGAAWTSLLDPNGAAAYDATKYSTSLIFTTPTNPNSVNVRVVIGKKILSKWYYGSASSQVFYRNA